MIEISDSASISPLADIEDSVRGTKIIIGKCVMIDAFVKIKPAGGLGDLIIGAYSYINSGTVLYTGNGINIGEEVLIAANCTFAPVNHEFSDVTKTIRTQGFRKSKGGIVVENDVWIGANSVILDGAVINTGCVVSAGSVVRGILQPRGIYAGAPAKMIGIRE